MPCCEPVECRDCQPRRLGDGDSDSCSCGVFYLNGVLAGILAQFLLASGLLFSVATVGDCSLVETDLQLDLPGDEFFDLREGFNFTTNLGLIFFAKPNGDCYWYDLGNFPENQFEWYINDATPDWNVARGFAALGVAIGLIVFLYSLSVTCSAQKRGMRRFIAFILSVALACFQCLTFLVFPTEFCDGNGCRASRTSSFCTVSACLYFWGGICFLLMSDYPGATLLAEDKMRVAIQDKPTDPMEENEPVIAVYAPTTETDDDQLHQISPESSVEMETYSLDPENPHTNNESLDGSSDNIADTADDATTRSESPYHDSELDQVIEANSILETDQKSDEVKDEKEDEENASKPQENAGTPPPSMTPTDQKIEPQDKDETAPLSTNPKDENHVNEVKEAANQHGEAIEDDGEQKGGSLPEI